MKQNISEVMVLFLLTTNLQEELTVSRSRTTTTTTERTSTSIKLCAAIPSPLIHGRLFLLLFRLLSFRIDIRSSINTMPNRSRRCFNKAHPSYSHRETASASTGKQLYTSSSNHRLLQVHCLETRLGRAYKRQNKKNLVFGSAPRLPNFA